MQMRAGIRVRQQLSGSQSRAASGPSVERAGRCGLAKQEGTRYGRPVEYRAGMSGRRCDRRPIAALSPSVRGHITSGFQSRRPPTQMAPRSHSV